MASFILKNAHVALTTQGSTGVSGAMTNISTYVTAVSVAHSIETQEDTAMGDSSRYHVPSLKNWALDVTLNQDFAAAAPGGLGFMFNCLGSTALWWQVRPDSGSPASTNPEWRGYGMITDYPPLDGSVGDLAKVSLKILGLGDLTRGTTTTTA